MTYIFPERGKIDKTQFILDRLRLVLKTCKMPTTSLNFKSFQFLCPKNFLCAKFYGLKADFLS